MTLLLDAGNSRLSAGLMYQGELIQRFSLDNKSVYRKDLNSKDVKMILEENLTGKGVLPGTIRKTAISSVLKNETPLLAAAGALMSGTPAFILDPLKPGELKNKYLLPEQTGPDRLAAALGGISKYPGKNLIIIDWGTATTIDAVSRDGCFLGGTIFPGLGTAGKSLGKAASALPEIQPGRPVAVLGKNTEQAILSGLFYSQAGAVREIIRQLGKECFSGEDSLTIGTGGYAPLFHNEELFDRFEPDLVLLGLYKALPKRKNNNKGKKYDD